MAIRAPQKKEIIDTHQRVKNDTGSSEVQIALLTADIKELSEHFAVHKKDQHSRMGLMRKIQQREKLLNYLYRNDLERYKQCIAANGLRDKKRRKV